jgi:carbamoyltransferase
MGPLARLDRFDGGSDDLSQGMFYNAFAGLMNLREAGRPAAGKLMGLAPFGQRRPEWPALIELETGGDTQISLQCLDDFFAEAGVVVRPGCESLAVNALDELLIKYAPLSWRDPLAADLACKAQEELEAAVLHISRCLRRRSSASALAYAGGVALNCTANRRLAEAGWVDVFVQPAATDDGNALGLAYYGWIELLGHARRPERRFNPFTGRRYTGREVSSALATFGLAEHARTVAPAEAAAERIARGEIVCWFQGASEWGPRALGARSIIASPLLPGMRDRLNAAVKHREAFRPFAVSGTAAGLAGRVELSGAPSALRAYMLVAAQVTDACLAEVRHVHGSVRFQLVDPQVEPVWYALIEAFGAYTGVAVVLNTSFNTFGEPLVETPVDAVRQFLLAGADALYLDHQLLAREAIPAEAMRRARQQAWRISEIDALHTALGLEAAGYLAAALQVIQLADYTSENAFARGPAAIRGYHGLQLRAAVQRGDTAAAGEHADMILRWSGLPAEALPAAQHLAGSLQARQRAVGQLMRTIAGPGEAYYFLSNLPQD